MCAYERISQACQTQLHAPKDSTPSRHLADDVNPARLPAQQDDESCVHPVQRRLI